MTKLYEQDYYAWTQDQADAPRRRSIIATVRRISAAPAPAP